VVYLIEQEILDAQKIEYTVLYDSAPVFRISIQGKELDAIKQIYIDGLSTDQPHISAGLNLGLGIDNADRTGAFELDILDGVVFDSQFVGQNLDSLVDTKLSVTARIMLDGNIALVA